MTVCPECFCSFHSQCIGSGCDCPCQLESPLDSESELAELLDRSLRSTEEIDQAEDESR
jgi:hypothetical protein